MVSSITLDRVPATLGAWDRMVLNARQQNLDNQCAEAERAAKVEQNVDDLEKILARGDLRAPVFFARRTNPIKAPQLRELLWDAAVESNELPGRLLTLLFFASEGCDVREYAKELRKALVLRAAEEQA